MGEIGFCLCHNFTFLQAYYIIYFPILMPHLADVCVFNVDTSVIINYSDCIVLLKVESCARW